MLTTLIGLALAGSVSPCTKAMIKADANSDLQRPAGFDGAVVTEMTTDGTNWSATTASLTKELKFSSDLLDEITKGVGKKARFRAVWNKSSTSQKCAQEIIVGDAFPDLGDRNSDKGITDAKLRTSGSSYIACRRAASDWKAELARKHGNDFILVVFSEEGGICDSHRLLGGIEGDPIYTGVYAQEQSKWGQFEFEPCALQSTTPAIFVSADQVSISKSEGLQKVNYVLIRSAPRSCYNESVTIRAAGTNRAQNPVKASATLKQYRRYRATLQLGILLTDNHRNEFDLRPGEDDQQLIFNQGPTDRGPEYIASLVLYGLPWYLIRLFDGEAYRGRDIINEDGILDRLGGLVGVSLTDPTRRFVVGGTFELLYGVNVFVAADFLRQDELVGLSEGDAFSGSAGTIPTREVWDVSASFGFSLDLAFALELFSGRIRP